MRTMLFPVAFSVIQWSGFHVPLFKARSFISAQGMVGLFLVCARCLGTLFLEDSSISRVVKEVSRVRWGFVSLDACGEAVWVSGVGGPQQPVPAGRARFGVRSLLCVCSVPGWAQCGLCGL